MSQFNDVIKQLIATGIASPRLEARLLLAHVLGCESSSTKVLTAELHAQQETMLRDLLNKRLRQHCPLDKILGYKDFYKYTFKVNDDVLSPRPETEIIVEEAVRIMQGKALRVLDLGTGSGCILLSLLRENPLSCGIGVDISEKALDIARENAATLGIDKQVKWQHASWFEEDFIKRFSHSFEVIVSNPPYILEAEINSLAMEVKDHDPLLALSGGKDGLESYQKLAEVVPALLSEGGYVLLECGQGQAHDVAELFCQQGLKVDNIVKDLQGIERCVILKK